ncbi:MAG TPA: TolC family protein [Bryobacteraceae bacterium]
MRWFTRTFVALAAAGSFHLAAQNLNIDLPGALARAQQYGGQIETANIAALLAHEDRSQAKAGTLPSVNGFNQFIYTQGNGTASGVFVANDGVHVYNEQLQAHEELLALARRGEVRLAAATEAVARARVEVASRGLKLTVVQDYYAIAAAQRRIANAQRSLSEARQFLDITTKQEQGGEAAHADVIKAQLQVRQRERDVQDAQLAVQKAKIALAVLMFPTLRVDYDIVDDVSQLKLLPPLPETTAQARIYSPEVRAAQAGVTQARLGVTVARYGYVPSFGLDVFYGINANQFAAQTNYPTPESGRSTQPDFLVPFRQNLGYSAQATLNIPLWNWGATHSKVKQASYKRRQAELDLSVAQRQLEADISSSYQEAQAAFAQVESLRSSSDLSTESLRLTLLRYQAGEATALEVVDAQSTANLSRTAYDDGLVRYRVARAAVESLMGVF